MNRFTEISNLRFYVSGEPYEFPCSSGRLKYDESVFSIKCRVDGSDGINEQCLKATELEVSSIESTLVITSIKDLELDFESVSVSVVDCSSNAKYLIQGKGVATYA